MNSSERLRLLQGKVVNLQRLEQSNVVRIFICSTFSDMTVERNLLLENAYPAIRKFCQQIGLDFQVMDMRWGIQESAEVDHSICELCLKEIQTCKRLSTGPYFVAFIGNRYGYRPLQSNVGVENFEKFCEISKHHNPEDAKLLQMWYKLDNNAVPAMYILQPITSKFPYFDDNDSFNAERRKADRNAWGKVSNKLSEILRNYAKLAMKENDLNSADGGKFLKSVTEMEIQEGLLNSSLNDAVYLYRREITDMKEHVQEATAPKYVDFKEFGEVDEEAQDLLQKLKKEIDKVSIASKQIKTYQVKWISDEGISQKSTNHADYLKKFCNDFVTDMKDSISRSVEDTFSEKNESNIKGSDTAEEKLNEESDWLLDEVTHHALFAAKKCESFCGRKLLIGNIMNKLLDENNASPVTVHGVSGTGKSALLSKIIQHCQETRSDDIIAYRFLGTSPNSTHIHNVLQTLILQITEALGLSVPELHLLQNFNSVVQRFVQCLKDASTFLQRDSGDDVKNLVIVLDSLDQLSTLDGAHGLNWLPKQVPPHVKILLSTLPNADLGILNRLEHVLSSHVFIEVTDLEDETGEEILNTWLGRNKRAITINQHQLVMNGFRSAPSPLFLKLAFDEARTWHSYTDVSTLKMASSAREAISMLYNRLEVVHGNLFVSRALGYLVATKNGITEAEMDDLLSLDDEVLNNAYHHWAPTNQNTVRVPSLLWTRLRFDLGDDLVERQTVGHTVIALHHRQFIEVARERYLTDDKRKIIHRGLAEYFLGTWSDGRKKPLKMNIWKDKVIHTDRKVASQPLKFSERVFNMRKLDELPYHLLHSGMWQELCETVLFSANWMMNKIQAFAIKDVLGDFNMVLEVSPQTDVTLVRDALKLAKPTLEFPGGIRNHFCSELFGRLEYFKEDFPVSIGSLVEECFDILHGFPEKSLIPQCGCFQPPGGPLRTTLTGFSKPITCLATTENKAVLVAGSRDGSLIVWQMGNDEMVHNVKVHQDEIKCLCVSGMRIVSGSLDNTLHVMNMDTGSRVALIEEEHSGYDQHGSVALSEDGGLIVSACGSKINVWTVTSLQCKFTLEPDEVQSISCDIILLDNSVVIAGYQDGSLVAWNSSTGDNLQQITDITENSETVSQEIRGNVIKTFVRENKLFTWWRSGALIIFDIKTFKEISSFRLNISSCVVALHSDGSLFAVGELNKVHVWRIEETDIKKVGVLLYHHKAITSLVFDDRERRLVVGSRDEQITVWPLSKTSKIDFKTPQEVIKGMGSSVDYLVLVDDVIASASSQVFYIKLWNRGRNKIVQEPPTYLFEENNNVISPCGRHLAISDSVSNKITVHDLSQKHHVMGSTLLSDLFTKDEATQTENADHYFTCLCFIGESDYVICGTNRGVLYKVLNPLVKSENLPHMSTKQAMLGGVERVESIVALAKSNNERKVLVQTRNHEQNQNYLYLIESNNMLVQYKMSSEDLKITGDISAICLGDETSHEMWAFIGTTNCDILVIKLRRSEDIDGDYPYQFAVESRLSDHKSSVTVLSINWQQNCLFSGSMGRTRRLWQLKKNKWTLLHEVVFNSLLEVGVTAATFTRDGSHMISGSRERTIKIWEVSTGELVTAQYVYATVTGIIVSKDGRIVVTTKMGYVIIDEFFQGRSSPEGATTSRPLKPKITKRGFMSTSSNSSTACRIF